jgi:homoserine dehydrogenase
LCANITNSLNLGQSKLRKLPLTFSIQCSDLEPIFHKMKKLKIGIAGLGTVGKGVYEILRKDAEILAQKSQTIFEVVAVSSRSKKDFVDSKIKFYPNAMDLASDPEIDVVVEVIGGGDLAKNLMIAALKNGKEFVTANKALLAEHGFELAELAEASKTHVGFEAAVAGATPIIKAFKEGLAANEITEFYAILNGTCNFILSKMKDENLDFAPVLKEAQDLGFAELDPTFDIKGIDTAHKLALLAAIASGTKPAFNQLTIEGIDEISIHDIKLADELGYKIKLLAIYKNLGESCQQTVYPALVKNSEKIAQVDSSFNAILTNASNAGLSLTIGRGAGGFPTGSAVVSDLLDIATGRSTYMFGKKAADLAEAKILPIANRVGKYFLRLTVDKKLAQETNFSEAVFGSKIKVESAAFFDAEEEIICGFLTDVQKERNVVEALKALDSNLVKAAKFLRVEETNF